MSEGETIAREAVGREAGATVARRRVLLVGAFRSIVPEGSDSPFGSQGGFVDTLAPLPYSLANGYLKAYADADPAVQARWDIRLLDLSEPLELEDEREEVVFGEADLAAILAHEPDVVGFSTYCWNVDAVRSSLAELRRRRPGLRVVLGGRGTEGDPEGLLRGVPEADVAVCGEGEIPFRELLRRDLDPARLADVGGIVYRDEGGEVRRGAAPVAIQDLDTIPSPFQLGILTPPQHGVMMELSRGCLHGCGYCTWNSDKRLRWFGPARVEADIRWALANGHRHVTVNDSALNYDTDRMRDTVEAIRRADPDGELRFTYNVRHDQVTPAQLEILARLPTHMVLLGVETFTPDGMEQVDRAEVDIPRLRRTLLDVGRVTRPPVASIVLGLPGDTEAGFRHTLETLLSWTRPADGESEAPVGTVLVSLLQVYRGSTLWQRREALGLRFQEHGIPYLHESPTWPTDALARTKAYLLDRMRAHPDTLKAAEAVVLMEARGGLDPWFTSRRVTTLLRPWEVGMTLEGWTLEKVGVMRDTGLGVLVRFRWRDGGGFRLRMTRPDPERPPRLATTRYALELRPLRGPRVPPEAREGLVRLVHAALTRGERELERRTAARRARARAV